MVDATESEGGRYRYGFNGQENDNDIASDNYDFGARTYDSRIGRWLSTDPLSEKYVALSPYNFVANSPLQFIDADGKDFILFFVGEDDAADWKSLQDAISGRFSGLVTVSRTEFVSNSSVRHPLLENGQTYWKVSMTINEEKLTEMAKASARENASADLIELKKQEFVDKLVNQPSYKALNEIMTGPRDGLYSLDKTSTGIVASSTAFWGGPKGLVLSEIMKFDGIEGLSGFNVLLHEIREGYYAGNRIVTDPSLKPSPYSSSHWPSLLDQANDLGIDFISAGSIQYDPSKNFEMDGAISVNTYKKQKNGRYLKTQYEIKVYDGKIVQENGKTVYLKKSTLISKKQYESEKKKAKESLPKN